MRIGSENPPPPLAVQFARTSPSRFAYHLTKAEAELHDIGPSLLLTFWEKYDKIKKEREAFVVLHTGALRSFCISDKGYMKFVC